MGAPPHGAVTMRHDGDDFPHDDGAQWAIDHGVAYAHVGTYVDTDIRTPEDVSYNLASLGLMDELNAYLMNGETFGLAFDPDCHFFCTRVELRIATPEGGITAMLLGASLLAMAGVRRVLHR
jgi:hypothetical protein